MAMRFFNRARVPLRAWALLLLAVAATAAATPGAVAAAPSFTIANNNFVKDGVPHHLRAGCIHYSRVPAEYWEDRLLRLKAMGLNSIQTYVPWNWHEAVQGQFDWSGDRDLGAFLDLAKKVGLLVVVRAGPYMCGEWEFGGLPAWIFKNGSIPIRTYSEPYITHVNSYWQGQLLPLLKKHLYSAGGSVVMVQMENEFGSYGDVSKNPNDKKYLEHLISIAGAALGVDAQNEGSVILFTTDGGDEAYMTRGSLRGASVYTVGDGCGSPQTCADAQIAFNSPGKAPFMCSECYTGWLTHWGEAGANTSSSAPHVDQILGNFSGSISLYMGHGGTNFGWFSGANGGGGSSFQPHVTSYDYDSPVSESGEHGYHASVDKYAAMQKVMLAHSPPEDVAAVRAAPELPLPPRAALGTKVMTHRAGLLSNLAALSPTAAATGTETTPFAESLGPACHYGMLLYSAKLSEAQLAGSGPASLTISANGLRDRVLVFADGQYAGVLYRVTKDPLTVVLPGGLKAGSMLELLVENMGRINFSHGMDDERKGITGTVAVGGTAVAGWTTHCLPLEAKAFDSMQWAPVASAADMAVPERGATTGGPAFYKTTFEIKAPVDTFLAMRGWTKGSAWINGFNLGRYWETEGPQHTLFVPAPRLKAGSNELVVLEIHNTSSALNFSFLGQPILQPHKGTTGCNPTVGATAGAHVAMVAEGPKLAHQQQWVKLPAAEAESGLGSFLLKLKAMPTLCLTVEAGCPHPSSGCLSVEQCKPKAPGGTYSATQLFTFRPDPSGKPGVQNLLNSGKCLDIFSNGLIDGSPIDIWTCDKPGEPNQRWSYNELTQSLASAEVIQKHVPFVITVCTKSPP